jgi:dolichol-phosphate mannosyltransferase
MVSQTPGPAKTAGPRSNSSIEVHSPLKGPELTIVIPTFNERENVGELIRRLEDCLPDCAWEAVFVDDDSPDGTGETVREFAARDHRVRCIQRVGRRGLSTACIEGMLSSSAPFLAVIDGDLQHDERLLPEMLESLQHEDVDIVVGSRYLDGGGVGNWERSRALISRWATRLSRVVLREALTDPMSGFFMVRREAFQAAVRDLSGIGFKILLDIFASSPTQLRFRELPYEFRSRLAGESKLDNQVAWEYGMLLLDKLIGHIVPVRFFVFALIGSLGALVHLFVQAVLIELLGLAFVVSQVVATLIAMTFNFSVNNVLTYRDVRLRGWAWVRGLLSFVLACSVGVVANVGFASYIFTLDARWVVAAVAGIAVGVVWSYVITRIYTWKRV